jgi:hypothetical protein
VLGKVLDPEEKARFKVDKDLDGLEIADLPDLVVDNDKKTVKWKAIPAAVYVRETISKTGLPYVTFLNGQGCQYIKDYLEKRMREYPVTNSHGRIVNYAEGEKLKPESAILTLKYATQVMHRTQIGDQVNKTRGDHISTVKVRELVKSAITDAGFKWRPYIGRRYFDYNLLLLASARKEVSRDYVVFWMGHEGDIEATYTRNKGQLDPQVLEEMRRQYATVSEKYLETISGVSQDDIRTIFKEQFLTMSGMPKEEIRKLGDLSKKSGDELRQEVEAWRKKKQGLNGNSQKIVLMSNVEKWVNEGWEFRVKLPGGKAVIGLPRKD